MPQLIRERCTTKYYKILKELFVQVNFMEGKFLKDFRLSLHEYSLTHPGCTYEDLVDKFGAPEEIWYDYVSVQDPDYILSCVNKKHIAKWVKASIVAVCICCCLIWGLFYYRLYVGSEKATIDEHVIIIEEENEK